MSDKGEKTYKLVTAPVNEPVTAEEVRNDLRLTDGAEDAYINDLIVQARQNVEKYLNRALITQTWDMVSDSSPSRFALPYPPLKSVTSITSYDQDDNPTVNSADNYITVTRTEPGYVKLKRGASWVDHDFSLSFVVRFVAGYGDNASDVPQQIRRGIRTLAVKLYERRGDDVNLLLFDKDVMQWLQNYRAFVL
jgi:uncharacterized phiE125 gp8 family phage protein